MRWSHPAFAFFMAAAMSGCFGNPDNKSDVAFDDLPSPAAVVPSTLYLSDDGLMRPTAHEGDQSAVVPLAWSWGEYAQGAVPRTWLGPLAIEAYVVRELTATIQYTASQTVVSPQARPEFTAWAGVGEATMDHRFEAGETVFSEGSVQTITFAFVLPPGGMVVPVGERLLLRVANYYADGSQTSAIGVVVNAIDASRVDVVGEKVVLPPVAHEEVLNETKQLRGEGCATYSVPVDPEIGTANYPIEVSSETRSLHVELLMADFQGGGPDVDIELFAPDGTLAGQGVSPMANEAIDLYWPNLNVTGPGTYTLHVFACLPQVSTVQVVVTLGLLDVAP